MSSRSPRHFARALLIGSFAIASGCSFLLDFPKEGGGGGSTTSASSTGASSVSGSGAGGSGGMMACYGSTAAPSVDQLTWQGAPVGASAADVVRTTGLFRAKSTNLLYAFGSTTNGLVKPSSPTGSLFLVQVQDDATASLVQSGQQCGGLLHPIARRLTALADDSTMLFASSLSILAATGTWGFDGLGQTGCGTGGEVTIHAPTALQAAQVPFMGGSAPDPLDYTDGVALDLDYAFPRRELFGVGGGDTDNGYFLRVKDETLGGPGVTTWLSDVVFINGGFREGWTGGVALDATG